MITIQSRDVQLSVDGGMMERAQIFTIRIPDKDVLVLDFDDAEMNLIKRANDGDESPKLMLRILLMIVEKIEKRQELLTKEGKEHV